MRLNFSSDNPALQQMNIRSYLHELEIDQIMMS